MTDLKRIASRWDKSEWAGGIPKDYWSHHPIIDAYINSNIIPHSGNMLEWLVKNFLQKGPCETALSLCCGLGVGDRQALSAGVCHKLEGFDLSPASVKTAQEESEKAGFGKQTRYWVDNANSIVLEKDRYDIALSFGALHHIEDLEHICDQLQRALKPGSYIFLNEFVGPKRMQYTEQQLEIINRVMTAFPREWRRSEFVKSVPVESMIASDPSEAVKSDEIISVLCNNFELVDYCDYGGALLMPLWGLGTIPDIFTEDNSVDKQVIIKLLVLIDELLAENGLATSNYAQLVLRNNPPLDKSTVSRRISVHSTDRSRWVEKWLTDTVFSDPPVYPGTPWRQLPGKAWQVLRSQGIKAVIHKTGNYLKERIRKN